MQRTESQKYQFYSKLSMYFNSSNNSISNSLDDFCFERETETKRQRQKVKRDHSTEASVTAVGPGWIWAAHMPEQHTYQVSYSANPRGLSSKKSSQVVLLPFFDYTQWAVMMFSSLIVNKLKNMISHNRIINKRGLHVYN